MQAAGLLLLASAAIAVFIRAETRPMTQDELKIEAGEFRSFASEGRLLSEQFLAGQLTETFFETQTHFLQDKAKSERKKLDSADPEKGFELKHWQARHLGKQVEEDLTRLENKQTEEISRTKDELANLFSQLKELEDSLKN